MSSQLRLDWCDLKAASYACKNWHYSKAVPVGKLAKVGVWEDDKFIGAVLFGRGANMNMCKPFSLAQEQCVELVRVALREHSSTVSKIVSVAIRFLRKANPKLRLIVSYADPSQGHHGGIYQAGNWLYTGVGQGSKEWFINGRWVHNRIGSVSMRRNKDAIVRNTSGKHRYIMPLDSETRARIMSMSKPYPKRVTRANSGVHPECGGSIPTGTLHSPACVNTSKVAV